MLVDNAFGQDVMHADRRRPARPGEHNVTNALAAAGLALAVGATGGRGRPTGCAPSNPAGTAMCSVARARRGAPYFDDSKATNPHAALASLQAYPRVVWIAGGQLKGAAVDDLVRRVADRLAGVVMLGVDAPIIDRRTFPTRAGCPCSARARQGR